MKTYQCNFRTVHAARSMGKRRRVLLLYIDDRSRNQYEDADRGCSYQTKLRPFCCVGLGTSLC